MINRIATTHCSFLRLKIKREDIIDQCRECDKDRSIHNFTGCLFRVKQINLHGNIGATVVVTFYNRVP
jgi:hypothetical protein